jgi:hypothetical protein
MGIGILLAYIFGAFLSYYTVPLASLPVSIIFLLSMYRVPETPLYLLKIRQFEVSFRCFYPRKHFKETLLGFRTRKTH